MHLEQQNTKEIKCLNHYSIFMLRSYILIVPIAMLVENISGCN